MKYSLKIGYLGQINTGLITDPETLKFLSSIKGFYLPAVLVSAEYMG